MNEKDILGYAPLSDNKLWEKKELRLEPTHIREQLSFRRKLCGSNGQPLPPGLQLGLVTNEGLIEGIAEIFQRIEQDDRLTIFTYHSPIVMNRNLSIIKVLLLTPTNQLISTLEYRNKLNLIKNEFYRVDHYFYIV